MCIRDSGETATTSTPTSTQIDWPQRDAEALAKIHLAVTDTIFPRIMNATSAKQAWDILKAEFEGNEKTTKIRLQNLRREFENLKMKEGETIKDYSSRVIKLVNELKSNGESITDQRVIEKMLVSLSEKFDTVVTVIEESKDLTQLSISELIVSLQIHEDRMSRRNETSGEGAFQSKHKISPFKRNNKGGTSNQCSPIYTKNAEKKSKFLHVLYARRQTMQKRIAGTKENASAIIAKNSIIMKMSVDSKTNKQEDPKQLMMKIIYSMLVRMEIVRRMLGSLTVVAQTI